MDAEIRNLLQPLFDVVYGVEKLINENDRLKEENEYLKERLEWHENVLKKNAKESGEAVGSFIKACLDGRIKIEDNKTIIES